MRTDETLDKTVLLTYAPPMGGQIHINHPNCPAGEDTKQRLYIKSPEDRQSLIMGYCHNCGRSGVVRHPLSARYTKLDTSLKPTDSTKIFIPEDAEYDPRNWPEIARSYITQYGFDANDIREMSIAYIPSQHRLLYPFLTTPAGAPMFAGMPTTGYQLRRLTTNEKVPKYITVRHRNSSNSYQVFSKPEHKTFVICEDILSAFAIYRAGFNSIACRGTNIPKSYLFMLSKARPEQTFVIWLDNDNSSVIETSEGMVKFLSMIHPIAVGRVATEKDPKVYNTESIIKTIFFAGGSK